MRKVKRGNCVRYFFYVVHRGHRAGHVIGFVMGQVLRASYFRERNDL